MKCMRGGERNASAPRTPTSASCAIVWPPRLDPPVPRTTTSVAPARSRAAARSIPSKSSVLAGRRNSGRLSSACALRSQTSAASLRRSVSSSTALAIPWLPTVSARALSISCWKGMPLIYCVAAERFHALCRRLVRFGQPLRAADHQREHLGVEQALGDALGAGKRHRVDHRTAPLGIVDAQLVELDLHQLSGDLARRVEAKRIRA